MNNGGGGSDFPSLYFFSIDADNSICNTVLSCNWIQLDVLMESNV